MAGIFKAYDIRGIAGEALNERRAYWIGRGLATEIFGGHVRPEGNTAGAVSGGQVVVSRDMRSHSPGLAAALIRGLGDGGCDVLDVGLAATPMNYWANVHYAARGSVTVTASHNGPEYNGFKVSGAGATPLDFATGLDKVEAFVLKAEAETALAAAENPEAGPPGIGPLPGATGKIETVDDILTPYLDFMMRFVEGNGAATDKPQLKIGIDAANGMAGFFLPELAKRLPWIEIVPLYWELDGTFPNHEADPLKPENLHDVEKLVRREGCDFGVAFDGDADRCMFVDEKGDSISSDLITALIAAHLLKQSPGSPILYDLRSSHIVPEWIEQHGGVPVRGRVGHSFMKRLLKEKEACFGGELSGHYYFRDCFNTDSGLMALIQVLNIWRSAQAEGVRSGGAKAEGVRTLSELVAPLRRYAATGELNFHVDSVSSVLQKVENHYGKDAARLDHLDGLTVELADWWFNLRPSNTEPLLRLNLEAPSNSERDARLKEVKEQILAP